MAVDALGKCHNCGASVMASLAVPTVHLGGTSKDELLEQVVTAGQAVQAAAGMVARAYPNARDYIGRPVAYALARDQHGARLDRLHDIAKEYEALAISISEGGYRA